MPRTEIKPERRADVTYSAHDGNLWVLPITTAGISYCRNAMPTGALRMGMYYLIGEADAPRMLCGLRADGGLVARQTGGLRSTPINRAGGGTMKDFARVLRLGKQRDVGMTFCRVKYKGGVLSITGVEGPCFNGNCHGAAGQIVMHAWDFVEYAPGFDAAIIERFRQVWADWHLNDMQAGTPRQTAWIEANPRPVKYPQSHYEVYRDALSEAGLNPDTEYLHHGKPYEYGSAWLHVEVPEEVLQFLYDLPDTDIQPAWV